MKFDVTADNRSYLEARGKIILNACPGSGKTSAVSFKLTNLISECERFYGAYSGVACLSFTNVAKDEINGKYHLIANTKLRYPHLISTIDSFINQYITLPFYYLQGYGSTRPVILDEVGFLDNMNFGWFANKRGQPLKVSYPPSKIKIEMNGTLTVDGSSANSAIVDPSVFGRFANKVKSWQFEKGYLNNDDSTYIAYQLLMKFPQIAISLVRRFPYIIIDEAQDTSEIQYKIFDLLVSAGLENMEFVGDPYQSLYEFREARPNLFLERFADTANWQTLRFNDCRRSSQNIIDAYSLLRVDSNKIVSTSKCSTDHSLKVIRYDENNLAELIAKYESLVDPNASNQILVRGSTHLEQFGVKSISDNPWKTDIAKTLIRAEVDLKGGNTKAAIDTLRMLLVQISMPDQDYKTHRVYSEALKLDTLTNINLFDFARDMPTIDDTVKNWNDKMTQFIKDRLNTDVDLQLKQKKGAEYYNQNLRNFLYPKVELTFPVSTIHKAKGMTFNSVMLVLSNNSSGEKISLSDFIRPIGMPTPKQRMIYVALSRPEVLCCLAVPNSFTEQKIIDHLGTNLEFI